MKINLGPREADLLADALITLLGEWEGTGAAYAEDYARWQRVMDKVRTARQVDN